MIRPAMTAAAVIAAAGAVHTWVNRRALPRLVPAPRAPVTEAVAVLVPARDEATTITGCLADLRAQTGLADLAIIVLDDASGDDTAAVATAAAAGDPRVTVLVGTGDPPPGWLGKPYACARLAAAADAAVLVFVDADVRLHPQAVAAAVAQLRAAGADLLSAWPRQHADTALARLVQPLQQWSWLTTLPLGIARRSRRASLAAANGQFLVVDAAGYAAAGGHGAVAGAVLEDIELARAVKRAGGRADIADASALAGCRMYAGDRDLVHGYAKSLWAAFGGPGRGVAMAALLAGIYGAPALVTVFGRDRVARLVAAAAVGAGITGRALAAAATGGRVWPDSAAHPVSVLAFAALMVVSVRRRAAGTLRWRGRPVTIG